MINRIKKTSNSLAVAASLLMAVPSSYALDVVFINDGHVAPYHVSWLGGFDDAIESYNDEFGNVNGHWLSAEGSLEKMIQQIETTINEKPDIMFVNAMNADAIQPLIQKAKDKGITWVSVHSKIPGSNYNFLLGDVENGYNQGLAMCALSEGKPMTVGLMLGQAGNPSGDARRDGILKGVSTCNNVEIVAKQPADWDTVKAQSIAENWFTQYPELNAISGVTDAYLYPSIAIAQNNGKKNISFYGYDGDIPILKQMLVPNAQVKSDILLSGTREGWNMIQMAYRLDRGDKLEQDYNFFTPLVLSKENYKIALANGLPKDVIVYDVNKALEIAQKGYLEFGTDSVKK